MPNAYLTGIAAIIAALIAWYQNWLRRPGPPVKFTLSDESGKDLKNMVTNITVNKQRLVRIDPSTILDAKGNVTKIDGKFTYKIDSTSFQLFPADDGLSCAVLAVSPTETDEVTTLEVDADVDLGPGVKLLPETTQFTASSEEAVTFTLSVGPETDPV
ncbi:MAG: hypothetical protein ACREJN_12345 [Nitrospiraceae bacterium]